MKTSCYIVALMLTLPFISACDADKPAPPVAPSTEQADTIPLITSNKTVKLASSPAPAVDSAAHKAAVLVRAYPDFLSHYADGQIVWKDGCKQVFDDGMAREFEALLDAPDLEDQLKQAYPKGQPATPPQPNEDPGRFRNLAFFSKMYGDSPQAVKTRLTTIRWMPNTVNLPLRISSVNGIDQKLTAVSQELDKLPANLKQYVSKPGGTFNWRTIAGTQRPSAHAFGIAIDITPTYAGYWRWDKTITYKNRIPMEIVEIFEKHGFIWGGRWYHYDTMHFEYRPELLDF